MESKENIFSKLYSIYESAAKNIVLTNLFVEISLFITSCILFLLFGKYFFFQNLNILTNYNSSKLDKELQTPGVYKGIALIVLFLSMMYFAYNSVFFRNIFYGSKKINFRSF